MMCTANIPLERFFFFSFFRLRFILILLFCIWVSSTFVLHPALGFGLDHFCNEVTFCMWLFVMYTYTGNVHER